jgi:DNA-binding beta-propeller fold protein YncE
VEEYHFERYWPVLKQPWYFNNVEYLAIDSKHNVYVIDSQVQKYTFDGLFIKNLHASTKNFYPVALTIDHEDNVYVLSRDWGNNSGYVLKFNANGNEDQSWKISKINTFPSGIAVDSNKHVYVTTRWGRSVLKLAQDGSAAPDWKWKELQELKDIDKKYTKILGKDKFGEDIYRQKDLRMAIDSHNNFYILVDLDVEDYITEEGGERVCQYDPKYDPNSESAECPGSSRICKYDPNFELVECRGNLHRPHGITVDKQDHIYITDSYGFRVLKYTSISDEEPEILDVGTTIDPDTWNKTFNLSPFFTQLKNDEPLLIDLLEDLIDKAKDSDDEKTDDDDETDDLERLLRMVTGLKDIFTDADSKNIPIKNIFVKPSAIAVGGPENNTAIFVTYDHPHHSIRKFAPDGKTLLAHWSSSGNPEEGKFYTPTKLALDKDGDLYVADSLNNRIVKFDSEGKYITAWGKPGNDDSEFILPIGIATDTINGEVFVYVVDFGNIRIQKFRADGEFVTEWPLKLGIHENRFALPLAIAVDSNHNVYVVDSIKGDIKKFDSDGNYKITFGKGIGDDDGQFKIAAGITIDKNDNIYVTDLDNHRVQQFDKDGNFVWKFGRRGNSSGIGQFEEPLDVTTDDAGNVYVADASNRRIQKIKSECIQNRNIDETDCIITYGSRGASPGKFGGSGNGIVGGIAVTPDEQRVYAIDMGNNRVQVFNQEEFSPGKAIIIAGRSGKRDNLWDATQAVANSAYYVLMYQRFLKRDIRYLSADINLDLDHDGDKDVYGKATLANVEEAIEWAKENGNKNLTLYMVDHGGNGEDGNGVFHLNVNETLKSTELNEWLNKSFPDSDSNIKIIYDACRSGSFLPHLKSKAGDNWIVITSATAKQDAYFDSQGSLSFSNFFWGYIFNGLTVAEAFDQTSQTIKKRFATEKKQTPQIRLVGYKGDERIGNGTTPDYHWKDIPDLTRVNGSSPSITLLSKREFNYDGTTPIRITADVTDPHGKNEVRATVNSPTTLRRGARGQSFVILPKFYLKSTEENRYEATYSGFTRRGTYNITIHAKDALGNEAQPQVVTVNVVNVREHKAILIAGAGSNQQNIKYAYEALQHKGIDGDNILLVSNEVIAGVDITPIPIETFIADTKYYLNTRFQDNDIRSLVIYIEGINDTVSLYLDKKLLLSFKDIATNLDNLKERTQIEHITVVYEDARSGYLLPALALPEECSGDNKEKKKCKSRTVITSTDMSSITKCYQNVPSVSFSKFFWQEISNGSTVQAAFNVAKNAVVHAGYISQFDINADGFYNSLGGESQEGNRDEYLIGENIVMATIAPNINEVSQPTYLDHETTMTNLWADVTTTEKLKRVWAVICSPDNSIEGEIELKKSDNGRYQADNVCINQDSYSAHFYAEDEKGRISFPSEKTITNVNQTGLNCYLKPNQLVYHNGDMVKVTLPDLRLKDYKQYIGIELPDGQIFVVTEPGKFQLYDGKEPPVWNGKGNTVIDGFAVTSDTLRGKYHLHLILLPEEAEFKQPPDMNTWAELIFEVEN